MSTKGRQILDVSVAPQKLSQFRESLQGAFETCDAKVYAEYIAEDVSRFVRCLILSNDLFDLD